MKRLQTRTPSKFSPNLRRGFFIALAIVLSLTAPLYSASSNLNRSSLIQGLTLDIDGAIVPYVSIIFKDSETFILSDENGHFSFFPPIQGENSVLIQRIGYQRKMLGTDDLIRLPEINLVPLTLPMQAVEVHAEPSSNQARTTLSQYTKTSGSGTQNHSKILSHIPGIHIKSYGGPAGISTLSLDGGPSSHTRVLVNGIDITSAQNGETDISQLPLPFIESMQYIPYDITSSGNGGIDGTIKLESGDQLNHVNLSAGSFGHSAVDVYLKQLVAGFWTSLQFGQRSEAGNYPVTWEGEKTLRRNNGFDQDFGALTLRKLIRPDLYWLFSTMTSRQSRGVSGLLWSNDTISHRSDRLQLTGSALGWIHKNGSTHFKLSIRNSSDNYINPYFRIDSDHDLKSYNLYLNDERSLMPWLDLISDVSYHFDEISSSEVGQHTRSSVSLAITPIFQLPMGLKIIPSFKHHTSPELYNKSLRGVQIQIPLDIGPLAHLAASQGEIFRYPSFNDLYWIPGGNPQLQAEETDVTTYQAGFDLGFMGDVQLQTQKKKSTNLIQWMPVLSYWHPVNVQSATRESTKLIWQLTNQDKQFSVFAHTSWINTRDHMINQVLRYSPTRTSAMGITWAPDVYEFNVQYDYVSDRISMYGYPEHTILEATELWSMSFARFWQTTYGNLTMVLAGENLGNISYETIKGYPEPGRSFRFTLNYAR
ncbi:MAG: TonB-dependent receptor [Candidatus Marinimicrobia bacterium]|nr:TonB-dependent receptor [Candidatus Neomarinimicrobiota bacterium]